MAGPEYGLTEPPVGILTITVPGTEEEATDMFPTTGSPPKTVSRRNSKRPD